MYTEFDIVIDEVAKKGRACAVLGGSLTPQRLHSLLDTDKSICMPGLTSDVYPSVGLLTTEEALAASNILGRPISERLVVRVAKPDGYSYEQLRRDYFMITRPEVQPFAIACSHPLSDLETGRQALLLEMASGIHLTIPKDVISLTAEDFDRICYQLALIAETFCGYNVSPNDIAKDFYYLKSIRPPRIILYDLAFIDHIKTSGSDRASRILRDQKEIGEDLLRFLFASAQKSGNQDYTRSTAYRVVDALEHGKLYYHSFAEMAAKIAEGYGDRFVKEYEAITGKTPFTSAQAVKFTEEEFLEELERQKRYDQIKEEDKRQDESLRSWLVERRNSEQSRKLLLPSDFKYGLAQKLIDRAALTLSGQKTRNEVITTLKKQIGEDALLNWAVNQPDGRGRRISLGMYLRRLELAGKLRTVTNAPNTPEDEYLMLRLQVYSDVSSGIFREMETGIKDRSKLIYLILDYAERSQKYSREQRMILSGGEELINNIIDTMERYEEIP